MCVKAMFFSYDSYGRAEITSTNFCTLRLIYTRPHRSLGPLALHMLVDTAFSHASELLVVRLVAGWPPPVLRLCHAFNRIGIRDAGPAAWRKSAKNTDSACVREAVNRDQQQAGKTHLALGVLQTSTRVSSLDVSARDASSRGHARYAIGPAPESR